MMKSIVSMLFVIAAALLLTSPIQAGYADGMNQYAAYHVMHGGVDPSGLLAANVTEEIDWRWTNSTNQTLHSYTTTNKDGETVTKTEISVGRTETVGARIEAKCKIIDSPDHDDPCVVQVVYDSTDIKIDFRIWLLHPRKAQENWPGDGGGWKKVAYHEYLHTQQAMVPIRQMIADAEEPEAYSQTSRLPKDEEAAQRKRQILLTACQKAMQRRIAKLVSTKDLVKAGNEAFTHDDGILNDHDDWQDAWDDGTFPTPTSPDQRPTDRELKVSDTIEGPLPRSIGRRKGEKYIKLTRSRPGRESLVPVIRAVAAALVLGVVLGE